MNTISVTIVFVVLRLGKRPVWRENFTPVRTGQRPFLFQRPVSELVNATPCKSDDARCDPGTGLFFEFRVSLESEAPGR